MFFRVQVDCIKVDEVDINKLTEYDLLAIGGPTHMRNLSKPMKDFLEKHESANVRGEKAFTFDTKAKHRFSGDHDPLFT